MIVTSAKYRNDLLSGERDNIIATIDGTQCYVPIDTDNTHYQAIQEWVSAGNTIEEAD